MSLIVKYSRIFSPNAETSRKVSTKKLPNKLVHLKHTLRALSYSNYLCHSPHTKFCVARHPGGVCAHNALRNSYPPTGKLYADEKKNLLFLLLSYHQCGPVWKGRLLNAFLRAGKHVSLASEAN